MVKVTNAAGDEYSGTIGKSRVYAKWKGIQYARKYVIPSNPQSPAQMAIRNSFTAAVDRTHTWNAYQKEAYKYEASGQPLTWFNLFISDWQKMTSEQRIAYVDPYVGFKQFGEGAATEQTETNVTDTPEKTTTDKPIVINSFEFTQGGGSLDPSFAIDILSGAIKALKVITGAITISYTSAGRTITNEAIQTNATLGEIMQTAYAPIDYQSVAIKVAATEVDGIEVDVEAGKFFVTKSTTFTGGSTYTFDSYVPVNSVNMLVKKAATNFKTWNDYSDANGILPLAQLADGGSRDIVYQKTGYIPQNLSNISAVETAASEYVALTANV